MPAVVGKMNVLSIGSATILQVGDIFWASPKSEGIIFSGPGSFNSGEYARVFSEQNVTLIPNDADVIDSSSSQNV
jgi:spore germination protein PA